MITEKPFYNLDGRESRTRQLREYAYMLANGKDKYYLSPYAYQSLCRMGALALWSIDSEDLDAGEAIEAVRLYNDILQQILNCPVLNQDTGEYIDNGKSPDISARSGIREDVWRWLDPLTGVDFVDAVQEGVRDAFIEIAKSATDAPCADFYDSIRHGVESAMIKVGKDDRQS